MRNVLGLSLLLVLPLLNGCAEVILGGAAVTGGVLATDRRTIGTVTEDQGIELRTSSRVSERFKDGVNLSVTSYNRMVLLTGEVPDAATRADIERLARSVENVRGIYNELAVAGVSSFGARANDSLITSKVKARFVDAQKFNALHVKVVTERNVVYLLGLVNRKEADDATEIARTTSGVQKVVRVFEYLD
ncbi:MAG: BON domain-containing protein [Betaproteobacteria bacterium]|jgi:osmotically-inducible protein OsmY|nr:BON domain-containing protein [Betaproteobacteria bacterium]